MTGRSLRIIFFALATSGLIACHHANTGGPGGDGGNNGQDSSASTGNDSGNPNGCTDLRCRVNMSCTGGAHTTLTGTVYAPNGTLPLYNAAVYVPNGTPSDFTDGVTCDRCDGSLSGDPITSTLTGSDGTFSLKDVPTGANVPLVIQLGRWRRQVTIANVPDCATTPVAGDSTRLPKSSSEGHLPMMAIASGKADPLECLFVKLGIDTAEVTAPTGTGRIHFYLGTDGAGLNLSSSAPSATQLYSSLANLEKYDVVLFPCEGEGTVNKDQVSSGGNTTTLTPDPRGLIQQYLDAGGRVFTTHYSYNWLTYANSPYNAIASPTSTKTGQTGWWPVGEPDDYNNTITGVIDTSFPKGMDFAAWLVAAGAQSAMGTLDIVQGRSDLIGVSSLAQQWVTFDFSKDTNVKNGKPAVMHMTFNTPLNPPTDDMGQPLYCGRVVYSDFHATANAVQTPDMGSPVFPDSCKTDAMTDQEKALAFMLFDLSSCVQSDVSPPIL